MPCETWLTRPIIARARRPWEALSRKGDAPLASTMPGEKGIEGTRNAPQDGRADGGAVNEVLFTWTMSAQYNSTMSEYKEAQRDTRAPEHRGPDGGAVDEMLLRQNNIRERARAREREAVAQGGHGRVRPAGGAVLRDVLVAGDLRHLGRGWGQVKAVIRKNS